MPKKEINANRIVGFDVARVISMFYIVGILHLSGYFPELSIVKYNAMVSLIWSTLGVFTFLSSYLLAIRYSFLTLDDVKNFYKKRLFRFYPLFLISSLLLLAIGFNTWSETLKGLLGISPFWIPQQHTLWYIAMLIGFYAITPILCIQKISLLRRMVIILSFLAIAIIIQLSFHSVDPRLFYYYVIYTGGILAAIYLKRPIVDLLQSKLLLLSFFIYVPLLIFLSVGNSHRVLMMLAGYAGIIILLNLSMLIGKIKYKFFRKVINVLSYSSMCMYLFHREIYWMLLKLVQPVTDWGGASYLFFVGLPLIMILSYWIQKVYDTICKSILI